MRRRHHLQLKKPWRRTGQLFLCCLLTYSAISMAESPELQVAAVFGHNAVLQREQPIKIWGWSRPADRISVSFAEHTSEAEADDSGRWEVSLPSQKASREPGDLLITSVHSGSILLHNIVVGDVWVVSGQSNMAWLVEHSDSVLETLDQAANADLRLLKVRQRCTPWPVDDVMNGFYPDLATSAWQPSMVMSARRFSAVGYHLGAYLQRELGVPIGVIESAVNGTRIEAWSPKLLFEQHEEFQIEREWLDCAEHAAGPDEEDLRAELFSWVNRWRTDDEAGTTRVNRPDALPDEPLEWLRKPTCFYNGMLHGLTSFGIKGFVWYQGESNLSDRTLYETRLEYFVDAIRNRWKSPDLPIVLIQIAPVAPRPDTVWIWDAQLKVARKRDLGIIPIGDLVDDLNDTHPRNKKAVGERAANWVLSELFGHSQLLPTGPLYSSASANNQRIQVQFENADGMETIDGTASREFQIAGIDKRFVTAEARIVGDRIDVWSADVVDPVAVRYAWRSDGKPDVRNASGFPMMPFRTDDWTPTGEPMFAPPTYQCSLDAERP